MAKSEWKSRGRFFRQGLVAVALMAGGVVCFWSAQAFASGALFVSKTTNLVQRETVNVSANGLAANAYGYVLECNDTPGEPTDLVGPPFDMRIPDGCSAPSLKHIVHTSAQGTMFTTYTVHESRKLGPPCSVYSVFGGCSHPDSGGAHPRADAQNYPCPPSPAQQAAGVTCSLVFYDTAQQVVSAPISFEGANSLPPGSTTTTPGSPLTTSPGSTGTTAPGSTGTTAPSTRSSGSGGSGSSGSSGTGGGGSTVVRAPSSSLAFTGLGAGGRALAVAGGILLLFGLVLFFVNLRRLALWLLGF
jgi:uncharacterized membrane protein YgcG